MKARSGLNALDGDSESTLTTRRAAASGRRQALRLLDACLGTLEDANEKGESNVSRAIADRYEYLVTGLHFGMPLADALDLVFDQQARYLRSEAPTSHSPQRPRIVPAIASEPDLVAGDNAEMTVEEAREVTEAIRRNVCQISQLLVEAHRRRAWRVLGYKTWEAYVRRALGISRSRSYELLIHGEVVTEIVRTANLSAPPDISVLMARRIRPLLSEVAAEVRERTLGLSPQDAQATVPSVVRSMVRSHAKRRVPLRTESRRVGSSDLNSDPGRLFEAVALLTTMAEPEEVFASIQAGDDSRLTGLPEALTWLVRFTQIWSADAAATGHRHLRDVTRQSSVPA